MKKIFTLAAAVLCSIGMWAETEYKLIDYSGATPVLSGDFISGEIVTNNVTEQTFTDATFNAYVAGVNKGIKGQAAVANQIYYDVKTTSATIKIYVYNQNSSSKNFYFGRLSECENYFDTTSLTKQTPTIIEREINCEDGGTRFVLSANTTDVLFYQVVVTEKGEALPSVGEAGYQLTGKRVGVIKQTDYDYNGVKIYSNSEAKFNEDALCIVTVSSNKPVGYVKFKTPDNGKKVVLKVTHGESKALIVDAISELPSGVTGYSQLTEKISETEKVLAPNTTYMIFSINSSVTITKLAFEAYVESDDATLKEITVAGNALDLSKFEEKDGALQYDYQLSMGTTEVPAVTYELNDDKASAEKTDAADVNGTTTIVVTAEDGTTTQTYKINFSVKSELGHDATLSSLKINGAEALEAEKFAYELEIGVYEALPTITYTLNDPNASAELTTATEETKVATIVVTAEDDETTKTYTVTITRAAATALVSISESTTWDWTKAGDIQASALSASTSPTNSEEINFADVLTNYDASFNAAALAGKVQWYNRKESNNVYAQGNYIKFNTTVAGTLVITFSGTNSTARELHVNGTKVADYSSNTSQESSAIAISAGEVLIEAYEGENVSMARIYKIVFTKTDVPSALDNTDEEAKAVKRIVNGQLIIEKNGKVYNVMGQPIR